MLDLSTETLVPMHLYCPCCLQGRMYWGQLAMEFQHHNGARVTPEVQASSLLRVPRIVEQSSSSLYMCASYGPPLYPAASGKACMRYLHAYDPEGFGQVVAMPDKTL